MEPYYKLRNYKDKNDLQQFQLYYFNAGKKLRLDVGVKTKAIYWNQQTQKIVSRCSEIDQDADQLNTILREKKQKLEGILLDFKHKYTRNPDTVYVLEQFYLEGNRMLNAKEVIHEFDLWIKNDKIKNIKNIRLYITILNDLKDYHPKPLKYIDLDYAFFNGFKNFYLDKKPPIQTSTIIKRMRSFKVFLNEKYKQGEIEDPVFQKYKVDLSVSYKQEIVIPTTREVEILSTYELEDPRLDDARDLYLIGCSTGLRYSDVIKLSFDRIKDGYIVTDILKTGRTLTIPLNPLSEKFIFKQFGKYHNKVREISNQKLNKALTDLFEYLAEKHPEKPFSSKEIVYVQYGPKAVPTYPVKSSVLAFHSARRYFISYCVNSGLIGLGNVMKWSGHTEIKTVNSYIKKGYNEQEQMKRLFEIS